MDRMTSSSASVVKYNMAEYMKKGEVDGAGFVLSEGKIENVV